MGRINNERRGALKAARRAGYLMMSTAQRERTRPWKLLERLVALPLRGPRTRDRCGS